MVLLQSFWVRKDLEITTATLRQEEHVDGGCSGANRCADLVGPSCPHDVQDAVADRVYRRVLAGMGLIIRTQPTFPRFSRN